MAKKPVICWQIQGCKEKRCSLYGKKETICWITAGTRCFSGESLCLKDKFKKHCAICGVYRSAAKKVPPASLVRLALCLQKVEELSGLGQESVSSQELGAALQISPEQLRKDFAEFSIGGRPRRGYDMRTLEKGLREMLVLNRITPAILIGCGSCAETILDAPRLIKERAICIRRVFAPVRNGAPPRMNGYRIYAAAGVASYVEREGIEVVFVATHDPAVVGIVNKLNHSSVKAILNFSSYAFDLDPQIRIFSFNLQVRLDVVSYYLQHKDIPLLPENALL